jgi:hypothetical protein
MDAGGAVAAVALQGVAVAGSVIGTGMKIEEGIADYNRARQDTAARRKDSADEATRRIRATNTEGLRQIGATREQGVLGLKEQSAQAAFQGRMAMTQAEMTASSAVAGLGASGVRAKGSPLMAAQQNVDLAFAAADRTIAQGNAGVKMGGLQLKTGLGNIDAQTKLATGNLAAQSTLATNEYNRRIAESTRKRDELVKNKAAMLVVAGMGASGSLASSFYDLGTDQGWW